MTKLRFERRAGIALALLWAGAGVSSAQERALEPFTATYAVEWRGMGAGQSTLELTRRDADTYVYRSSNAARGLFRVAFPGTITQTSTFSIVDGKVVPVEYRADDGTDNTRRDVHLRFDWEAGRVHGVAEEKRVDVPLRPGTQDPLSVQIALLRELAANRTPSSFWLIDEDEIKEYRYEREGSATLATELGALQTVIYRSFRPDSSRVTRMWLAPSLGFLPVRAEQQRRGRIEFAMQVRSVQAAAPAP